LAIKSLAYTPIRKDEEKPYKKCWYRPVSPTDEIVDRSMRFTFSQPTTSLIPPGEPLFFWKALDLAAHCGPLTGDDSDKLKELAQDAEPIFRTA